MEEPNVETGSSTVNVEAKIPKVRTSVELILPRTKGPYNRSELFAGLKDFVEIQVIFGLSILQAY